MSYYLLIEPPNEGITEEELYHHGIKGMHWGIRRFQPYQPGAKVKGGKEVGLATKVKQRITGIPEGIKQHKAQKKKAEALKKAQATRKANLETAAAKKKAIESGTVEDLAKFKGQLTNEEYTKAFLRLQNEKKLSDMVEANKTTVWDKVDKGMAIVEKVSKYANTIAGAKESFNKLNKDKNDAKKDAKKKEKNNFLNTIENVTQLNEGLKKFDISQEEYAKAIANLANKKKYRKDNDGDWDFVDKNTPVSGTYKQADKQAAEKPKGKSVKGEKWVVREKQKEPSFKLTGEDTVYDGDTSSNKSNAGYKKTNQLLLEMKDRPPSSSKDSSVIDVSWREVPARQLALPMKTGSSETPKTDSGGTESKGDSSKFTPAKTKRTMEEYMGLDSAGYQKRLEWEKARKSKKNKKK